MQHRDPIGTERLPLGRAASAVADQGQTGEGEEREAPSPMHAGRRHAAPNLRPIAARRDRRVSSRRVDDRRENERLALVTGTSTGIGRAVAIHLAQRGFEVLAGVRRPEDAPPGLEPIVLDVTSEGDVAAAAARVGGALHALVNNAGIAVNGPIEVVPVEQWRRQFEVNLIGQVAVTRALLPALLAARGRIVNIGSISGRVAWPLIRPYAASKFALEAVTDSLRREVGPHGVRVVAVEPGSIATPVWEKSRAEGERMLAAMPDDARRRYDGQIAGIVALAARMARDGLPPEKVADVVADALTARRPRTRYVVGGQAKAQAMLARVLPDRAYDALVAAALRRA
jgi:NAD(P)-dependent dehydrogenase (short-subunit alcohol dehydrogenase family)